MIGEHPLRRALTFLWVPCVVSSLLVAPRPCCAEEPPWLAPDLNLHVGVSALVAVAGYGVARSFFDCQHARVGMAFGVALLAGLGKEALDLAGYGDADWRDLLADLLGATVGALLSWALDSVLERARGPCRRLPSVALVPS